MRCQPISSNAIPIAILVNRHTRNPCPLTSSVAITQAIPMPCPISTNPPHPTGLPSFLNVHPKPVSSFGGTPNPSPSRMFSLNTSPGSYLSITISLSPAVPLSTTLCRETGSAVRLSRLSLCSIQVLPVASAKCRLLSALVRPSVSQGFYLPAFHR